MFTFTFKNGTIKPNNMREIENFELKASYYINTWLNGNKNHVKSEIAELFLCNPIIAVKLIVELPKEIRKAIADSNQLYEAHLSTLKKPTSKVWTNKY